MCPISTAEFNLKPGSLNYVRCSKCGMDLFCELNFDGSITILPCRECYTRKGGDKMEWWQALLNITPFVVNMVDIAEQAFRDTPKSGETKKALVTAATRTLIGGMHSVSTGGQKETWEQLAKPVDSIINASAQALFGKE